VDLPPVHLLISCGTVRFKVTGGLKKCAERDPGLAVQQLKMGLSKDRRHWSQFGEKTLELLILRHFLDGSRMCGDVDEPFDIM
jgi:hypothetical protein